MIRLLILLVIAGMLINAGCTSQEWQVYTEKEIKTRASMKMEVEGWMVDITSRK